MHFDPMYMIMIGITGALSMWAGFKVKSTFRKYSTVPATSGMTGAEIARGILEQEGITNVVVERTPGFLSDHYDPRNRKLRLSPDVYDGKSVAAAGVAAHEVGHALQHAKEYFPMKIRSFLAPAAGFGSKIGMWIIVAGLAMQQTGLTLAGIIVFSAMVAFVLVTLPVEFDASNRAKKLLPALGMTAGVADATGVNKVLNAAAMTYVASAAGAVMQLGYFVMKMMSQRR